MIKYRKELERCLVTHFCTTAIQIPATSSTTEMSSVLFLIQLSHLQTSHRQWRLHILFLFPEYFLLTSFLLDSNKFKTWLRDHIFCKTIQHPIPLSSQLCSLLLFDPRDSLLDLLWSSDCHVCLFTYRKPVTMYPFPGLLMFSVFFSKMLIQNAIAYYFKFHLSK